MKKLIGILAFVAVCSAAQAQELGVRFGDVLGNDVAVDALFSAGKFSRIHADVSFGSGVGVEALW
ncbi:MAG TPA: outer membrane insertion C- signal, partial [Cyclobacteriaceae bacterium]|nr:outer membrane insertion C- signal [Cyclobacteriaceae bacterium]